MSFNTQAGCNKKVRTNSTDWRVVMKFAAQPNEKADPRLRGDKVYIYE